MFYSFAHFFKVQIKFLDDVNIFIRILNAAHTNSLIRLSKALPNEQLIYRRDRNSFGLLHDDLNNVDLVDA